MSLPGKFQTIPMQEKGGLSPEGQGPSGPYPGQEYPPPGHNQPPMMYTQVQPPPPYTVTMQGSNLTFL